MRHNYQWRPGNGATIIICGYIFSLVFRLNLHLHILHPWVLNGDLQALNCTCVYTCQTCGQGGIEAVYMHAVLRSVITFLHNILYSFINSSLTISLHAHVHSFNSSLTLHAHAQLQFLPSWYV